MMHQVPDLCPQSFISKKPARERHLNYLTDLQAARKGQSCAFIIIVVFSVPSFFPYLLFCYICDYYMLMFQNISFICLSGFDKLNERYNC